MVVFQAQCFISYTAEIYSNEYVRLAWEPDQPVVMDKQLVKNPEYEFVGSETLDEPIERRNQSLYVLNLVMNFRRYTTYYIMQCFLPSVMLVLIAWFSFFQNPIKLSGRIGLCITAMLAIMVQFSSVNNSLPKVGYIKGTKVKWKGHLFRQSVLKKQIRLLPL